MKHFRILEIKGSKNKQYIIQYIKKIFLGLFIWKKFNDIIYNKYEDALNDIKQNIIYNDYETTKLGYHYIDAYKIFKYKEEPKKVKEVKEVDITKNKKMVHRSVFIPNKK